jgi:adenylate kinase family enzyme
VPFVRTVSIQGISGSGKTTLGAALAARLGVAHLETDALVHGPGWAETPDAALREQLTPILRDDGWVIDGDYERKLGTLVLDAADTVVWLDLPFRVTMWRLLRRTATRLWHRTELWNGNRESLRGAFWGRESLFGWAIRRHREYRRTLPERFSSPAFAGKRVVRLRSDGDVKRLLAEL